MKMVDTVGGVVEPPLGNLERNPRREVPTMGKMDKRVDWCLRTTGNVSKSSSSSDGLLSQHSHTVDDCNPLVVQDYGKPDSQARFWNGMSRPSASARDAVARDFVFKVKIVMSM
jgi:hypothetical protein